MNILDEIADKTRERVEVEQRVLPLAVVRSLAADRVALEIKNATFGRFPFEATLKGPDFGFICEVKKASPSKGVIAEEFHPIEIAGEYEEAGADAISCLTEPFWFLGSDDYLKGIVETVSIPVLRKDFVVDEYMIYQAKAFGASAVLLICAILDDSQLREYGLLANSLGLSALVEAHDANELERALAAGARIVGVNNRNLKDFTVDLSNAGSLRAQVPEGVVFVAESGVSSVEDVAELARSGADAALIGEALMRSDNKAALLGGMRIAAREARSTQAAQTAEADHSDRSEGASL